MPEFRLEIVTDDEGRVTEILRDGEPIKNCNYLRIFATPNVPLSIELDYVTIKHKKLTTAKLDERVSDAAKVLLHGKHVIELTTFEDRERRFRKLNETADNEDDS